MLQRIGSVVLVGLFLIALLAPTASSQDLPRQVLVGYWHNWGFSPNNLTLAQIPAAYDVVNVAFATPTVAFGATMSFTPDSGLYPVSSTFLTDVQALQAAGKRVVISIGGANDPVHLDTATDVQSFVTSMMSVITTWGFDGLDIDLEGGSLSLAAGDTDFTNPTTPRIVNLITALNQLLAQLPPTFLLTAAPETAYVQGGYSAYAGIWGAYLPVLHALRNRLTFVHTQHYNTGSMFGRDGQIYSPATTDFHVAMADMLISGFPVAGGGTFPPLDESQVAIGLPASAMAAGSGFTSATVVHDALDRLILGRPAAGGYTLANPNGHPRFRGLMTWSVNWDVHAGSAFSTPHRSYLDHVFLEADAETISVATGGTVTFAIRGGLGNSGRVYYMIPTAGGTAPGVALPGGLTLPINPDNLSTLALGPSGAPYFPGLVGVLNAAGDGVAAMILPPLPNAAGVVTHFAWFLAFPFDLVSAPERVDLVP